MCDYSLEHVASRPAKVGDKLISTKFGNSITRGFSAVDKPDVAVCLLPGTEVAFDNDVECEAAFGFVPTWKISQKVAKFCEVVLIQPAVHHDALEFPDGQIVKVARLIEGQQATVLQMPVGQMSVEKQMLDHGIVDHQRAHEIVHG